ncbi:MAG TPA: hypothetical protein PKA90_06950 [Ignavibacteria bacterium]|nr:hypothetical protein [Ignavibacteria bacterium]HMR40154.1 hypothetical protein [Ignavibacteria bacterium]
MPLSKNFMSWTHGSALSAVRGVEILQQLWKNFRQYIFIIYIMMTSEGNPENR